MDENYQNLLREVNNDVIQLLEEHLYERVRNGLRERGFVANGKQEILEYIGDKTRILYDFLADEPFSVQIDEKDSEAVSETQRTLRNILEDMLTTI